MKRLLVILLTLGMSCGAEAGLFVTVDGVVNPEDVELLPDEHAVIAIWGDGITRCPLAVWLILEGPGTTSGGKILYYGTLSAIYTYVPESGDGFEDMKAWLESEGFVDVQGVSHMHFEHGGDIPCSLHDLVVDEIDFRCDGAGDVRLTLVSEDLAHVYHTQIIHQSLPVYPGPFYVNAADGNDANSGISPEEAFATIQKAIDTAPDGDTITVAPGTYTEDINFLGKNIVLTGTAPANSRVTKSTTIDGTVTFRGTEDANCTLAGFNIDGLISGFDPATDPGGENHTHATISHCVFQNITTDCGNLIYACDGTISNCLIANISYMCERPSPVAQIVACNGLIESCTMVNMYDGIEVRPGGTTTLRNCILHRPSWLVVPSEATLNISYCNVKSEPYIIIGDGTVNDGPGNFEGDPCFASVAGWGSEGDYHLKSQAGRFDPNTESWVIDEATSPCIDAGDPMGPVGFEPFPNGGIINMGAYGGTAEASKSYFGKPPCKTIVAGDVNGDCIVDFKDMSLTFHHWLEDNSP